MSFKRRAQISYALIAFFSSWNEVLWEILKSIDIPWTITMFSFDNLKTLLYYVGIKIF